MSDSHFNASSSSSTRIDSLEQMLTSLSDIEGFVSNRMSGEQVLVRGRITRVLSDDNEGSRHQRLIIQLDNDQTLLIAHNIDLSPRIPNPEPNTDLYVYGEYEWNDQGGVIHWTHRDPDNRHAHGYLLYNGQKYE